jgi:hypothetical protein
LALTAACAAGYVVLSAPAAPAAAGTSATLSGSLDPLGINTAAWDGDFAEGPRIYDWVAAELPLVPDYDYDGAPVGRWMLGQRDGGVVQRRH